ncbi:MAG: tRNA 2-thiouridine(34) synthase MnmA [Pirellulales bacterium]|nr:tRNA 2-thiouridine(34) synthase MnmA [Pirellulales bacterium]
MSRVVLAMSGGVDSSVAAHLLLEQGHDVLGVFMRHGVESPVACATPDASRGDSPAAQLPIVDRLDHKQGCCTAADAADARRVADRLGIPFYALNLDREFARIIDYFVAEYAAGRTPNPCVQCNNWIKFGKLFEYADAVGAEFVATGHYARLVRDPQLGAATLLRGRDAAKDQSYVLFGIRRELLPRMLLPVGEYDKPAIRSIAADLGFDVATKRDSQEICFVTSGRYDDFVRSYKQRHADKQDYPPSEPQRPARDALPPPPASGGEFVLTDGSVVGRHAGIESFTVGQRKGLGIALGEPKFVVRIEPDTQRVVLGDRVDLGRTRLTARDCNWLLDPAALPAHGLVQVRYNSPPAPAAINLDAAGRLHVEFPAPQHHVAPGQAVVCYADDRVLGGGWIE